MLAKFKVNRTNLMMGDVGLYNNSANRLLYRWHIKFNIHTRAWSASPSCSSREIIGKSNSVSLDAVKYLPLESATCILSNLVN